MYLTAQRVRSSRGEEGINAFLHMHGITAERPVDLTQLAPERDPGTFVRDQISVPPPGNRVLSYLDIIALDDTTPEQLVESAGLFVEHAIRESLGLPWSLTAGSCLFRFGLGEPLVAHWRDELTALLREALLLRGLSS